MVVKHFISHRGNLSGIDENSENTKHYIENAINKGFECEIDLWVESSKISLGHDVPSLEISIDFLLEYKDMLGVHCKNLQALEFMNNNKVFNFFWHENDQYTLTSKNYIWTYPNIVSGENSIVVSLGSNIPNGNYVGICSDNIEVIRQELSV